MKPTDYIEWDNLKDIPFFLCQVVEDREKQDLDIYYLGKRVLHDYDQNDLIFGENFDGDNLDTLTPLTKKRFDFLCKRIKELDPYATI